MQGLWSEAKYELFCYVAQHRDCLEAIDWTSEAPSNFALENYKNVDAFIGTIQTARQRRNRALAVAEKYFMENGDLIYGYDAKQSERRMVPHPAEVPDILKKYHDKHDHPGVKATYHAIMTNYHSIPRKVVSDYIARCQVCMGVKDEEPDLFKAQSSGSEPVRLKRIGVDLTQFGHFWILTAIDYRSWFAWAWTFDNDVTSDDDIKEEMPEPEQCIARMEAGFLELGMFPRELESTDASLFQAHEFKTKFSRLGIRTYYPSQRTPAAGPRFEKLHNILRQKLEDLDPQNLAKPLTDLLFEAVTQYNCQAHPFISKAGQALSPRVALNARLNGPQEGVEITDSMAAHPHSGSKIDAIKKQVASLCGQIQQLSADDLPDALKTSALLSQAIMTHVTQSSTKILYSVTLPSQSGLGLTFKTSSADLQDDKPLSNISGFLKLLQQHSTSTETLDPLGDLAEYLRSSVNDEVKEEDHTDAVASSSSVLGKAVLLEESSDTHMPSSTRPADDEDADANEDVGCEDEDGNEDEGEDAARDDLQGDGVKEGGRKEPKPSTSAAKCESRSGARYSLRDVSLSINLHGDDYYCMYCDQMGREIIFPQRTDLRRHIEKMHLVIRKKRALLKCPECDTPFQSECLSEKKIVVNRMIKHTQKSHGKDWTVVQKESQKKRVRTATKRSSDFQWTLPTKKIRKKNSTDKIHTSRVITCEDQPVVLWAEQKKGSQDKTMEASREQQSYEQKKEQQDKAMEASAKQSSELKKKLQEKAMEASRERHSSEQKKKLQEKTMEASPEQQSDATLYFCFLCNTQPGELSQSFKCEESLRNHISIFHVQYKVSAVDISCPHCYYTLKEPRQRLGHLISEILAHGSLKHKIVLCDAELKSRRKTPDSKPGLSFHCFYCNDVQKMRKTIDGKAMKDCHFQVGQLKDHILKDHLECEDQEQWFPCPLCRQRFSGRMGTSPGRLLVRLLSHMTAHNVVTTYSRQLAYQCMICVECSVSSRIELRRHIEERHVRMQGVCSVLNCPSCGAFFGSSGDSKPVVNRFLRHIIASHEHQMVTPVVDGVDEGEISTDISSSTPGPEIKTEGEGQSDGAHDSSAQLNDSFVSTGLANVSELSFDISVTDADPGDGKVRYHCLHCKLLPPPPEVTTTAFLGMHELFDHFYEHHLSNKKNASYVKCPVCATPIMYLKDRPLVTGIRVLKHLSQHHSIDCTNLQSLRAKKVDQSAQEEHPSRDDQDGPYSEEEQLTWPCLLCRAEQTFLTRASLEEHLLTHLKAPTMQEQVDLFCPQCNWQTNGLGDLAPSKEIAVYNFVEHCIFSHEFLRSDYEFTVGEMNKSDSVKSEKDIYGGSTEKSCYLCANVVSFSNPEEFKNHLCSQHVQGFDDSNSALACPCCDFKLIRKHDIINASQSMSILHDTMVSHLVRHHQLHVPRSTPIRRCNICGHETIKSTVHQIHEILGHCKWKNKTKDPGAVPATHFVSCQACGKKTRKGEYKGHLLGCPVMVYEGDRVRPFQCQHCTSAYTYCHDLWKHMLRAHSTKKKESHPCPECNKIFNQKLKLDMHLWTVHKINRWGEVDLCPTCGLEVPKGMMGVHRHTHRPRIYKKFTCNICGKLFSGKRVLESHRLIHREKVQKCSLCPYQAQRQYHLANHMARVHHINRHPCTMCTFVASSDEKLDQHKSKAHPIEPTRHHNFCDQCQRWFANRCRYENHMFGVHSLNLSQREIIKCPSCNVPCLGASQLKNHMRIHKPPHIPCPACDKLFRFRGVLNEHIKYHHSKTLVKIPCHHCNETFPSRTARCRHIARVHGRKRQIPCRVPLCTFTTDLAADLKEHMKTHEDVKGVSTEDQLVIMMEPVMENTLNRDISQTSAPHHLENGEKILTQAEEVQQPTTISEPLTTILASERASETVFVVSEMDSGIQDGMVEVADANVPASLLAQLEQVPQCEGQETLLIIQDSEDIDGVSTLVEGEGGSQQVYSIVYTMEDTA